MESINAELDSVNCSSTPTPPKYSSHELYGSVATAVSASTVSTRSITHDVNQGSDDLSKTTVLLIGGLGSLGVVTILTVAVITIIVIVIRVRKRRKRDELAR